MRPRRIRHHEGALTLVRQLDLSGGGLEPNLDAFARHVEADQAIEIARMQTSSGGSANPPESAR